MSESSESMVSAGRDRAILSRIMTLIWRIFLLGIGGSFAFGGGILVAMKNPQTVTEKPLVVNLWERWQGIATDAADAPNPEQEELLQQIEQLQAQEPGGNFEAVRTQVEALQKQLEQAALESDSGLSADKFKVTLPGDFLFSDIESTLSSQAKEILDEYVVTNLKPYEGNTIVIAAYTDMGENPQINQELSFRRAKVIEAYLTEALEGKYRWVTVGYGKANSAGLNESFLNRRIEIAVD